MARVAQEVARVGPAVLEAWQVAQQVAQADHPPNRPRPRRRLAGAAPQRPLYSAPPSREAELVVQMLP